MESFFTHFFKRFFKGDKTIWFVYLSLCLVSLLEGFSATSTLAYQQGYMPYFKHVFFLVVGVAMVVACHNLPLRVLIRITYPLLGVSILLLIMVLVGGRELNDGKRWLSIFGFSFQPSELAKLALVMFVSLRLGKAIQQPEENGMKKAFTEVMVVTAVIALLIFTQNLSTALLICIFVYIMMIIAGVPWRPYLLKLTVFVVVFGGIFLALLYSIPTMPIPGVEKRWTTWHNRLVTSNEELSVLDPNYRRTDENAQVHHAKIAISEGRIWGKLPGNSSQRDFLPQAFSDFIYAIVIEELGWLGMIFVPVLFVVLMFRCRRIARSCIKPYPILLVLGCALIVSLQAFINMAVAVGYFPVTGQTLPIISKGGSSGMVTSLYFAIILSVSRFGAVDNEDVVFAEEEAEDQANERALNALRQQEEIQQELSAESYAEMAE